jgi:hypothetical protein
MWALIPPPEPRIMSVRIRKARRPNVEPLEGRPLLSAAASAGPIQVPAGFAGFIRGDGDLRQQALSFGIIRTGGSYQQALSFGGVVGFDG